MTSHRYDLEPRALLRLLAGPLVVVAGLAALMHAGVVLHLLPAPRPTLDVDRSILVHQVEASRRRQGAEILLLGDSSCLMDVDARRLGERLGRQVLNLGTLSYLDLNAAATLLRAYTTANPGRLQSVVVLLHPEALRRVAPEAAYFRLLHGLLDGQDVSLETGLQTRLRRGLGLEALRGRILCRLLPTPLPGAYGRHYGFTTDLERYLDEHQGSALDPESRPLTGSAEYRLAPQQEAPSRNFRAALPAGVSLLAGIAPVPSGFAEDGYEATRDRMLRQWSEWLEATAPLDGLPATLPDAHFASVAHLNADGVRHFTAALAEALRGALGEPVPVQ